jgi:membrane associated rhomboid family serine protease
MSGSAAGHPGGGPLGTGSGGGSDGGGSDGGEGGGPSAPPTCYVHPARLAGSVCRRCNRPICPECMTEAPVGWQCRRCVREGARQSPVRRWQPARGGAGYGRLGATRMTPMVIALIAINVAAYVWEMSSKPAALVVGGQFAGVCPHRVECNYGLLPFAVHQGQWYRLITGAFLHANIEHIAFNMFTLAIVGAPIEAELGRARFLALYFVSALGGSVGSYLISNPDQIGVGASGAIFGLMGAYFVIARRRRWDSSAILGLILINLLISFASTGIDWRAHLGGLVTGAIVGLAMTRSSKGWQLGRAGEMALGVGAAVAMGAVLSLLATLPPGQLSF